MESDLGCPKVPPLVCSFSSLVQNAGSKEMVLSSVLKLNRMLPQLVNGKINFKMSLCKFCEILRY